MLDDRVKLARYASAAAVPILNTDTTKWPIGSGRAGATCTAELAGALLSLVAELPAVPDGTHKAGTQFGNATRIWRMSHHLLRSLKATGVPKRDYQAALLCLLGIAEHMKAGPLYNDDGYNRVLDDAALGERLTSAEWTDAGRSIHRLAGALWSWTEALYFVAHEIGVELHGLYRKDGQAVLVRDYINLAPRDLWPDVELLPFSTASIIVEYGPDLDLYFDIYNNHYPVSGGFARDFRRGAVRIDGKPIADAGELDRLTGIVAETTDRLVRTVHGLGEQGQGKKYVEIFWYRLKPLFDVLGQDWRPPAEVMARIDADGIPPVPPQRVTPPEATFQLLNLL